MRSLGGLGWKGQQDRRRGKRSLVTLHPGASQLVKQPLFLDGLGALPRQPFSGHLLCTRGWGYAERGRPCLPVSWSICPGTGRGRRSSWLAVGSEGRLASAPPQKRNDPLALFSVLPWGVTCVPGPAGRQGGCGACLQNLWPRPLPQPPWFRLGQDAKGEQGWAS